jgi:hypothetical protein
LLREWRSNSLNCALSSPRPDCDLTSAQNASSHKFRNRRSSSSRARAFESSRIAECRESASPSCANHQAAPITKLRIRAKSGQAFCRAALYEVLAHFGRRLICRQRAKLAILLLLRLTDQSLESLQSPARDFLGKTCHHTVPFTGNPPTRFAFLNTSVFSEERPGDVPRRRKIQLRRFSQSSRPAGR